MQNSTLKQKWTVIMQEILKSAKELDDQQLESLTEKLNSILIKRKLKAKREAEEHRQKMEAKNKVIKEINEIAVKNGLSLEKIGMFFSAHEINEGAEKKRRTPTINPVNQTFTLVNGKPQLVFTRKAVELLRKGEAFKFDQLTAEQQEMAKAVAAEYNEKKQKQI